MRYFLPAAAMLLLAAQVQAQTTTPAAPAPTTMTPAPTTAAPMPASPSTSTTSPKRTSRRVSLKQHFDTANVTHDGRLTKDQATAAKWGYVTSNFSTIDKDHKGYVTEDDIHAYAKMRHAARTKKSNTPAPAAAPATNG